MPKFSWWICMCNYGLLKCTVFAMLASVSMWQRHFLSPLPLCWLHIQKYKRWPQPVQRSVSDHGKNSSQTVTISPADKSKGVPGLGCSSDGFSETCAVPWATLAYRITLWDADLLLAYHLLEIAFQKAASIFCKGIFQFHMKKLLQHPQ